MPIQPPRPAPDDNLASDPWIESVLRDMGLSSAVESLCMGGMGGLWRGASRRACYSPTFFWRTPPRNRIDPRYPCTITRASVSSSSEKENGLRR